MSVLTAWSAPTWAAMESPSAPRTCGSSLLETDALSDQAIASPALVETLTAAVSARRSSHGWPARSCRPPAVEEGVDGRLLRVAPTSVMPAEGSLPRLGCDVAVS